LAAKAASRRPAGLEYYDRLAFVEGELTDLAAYGARAYIVVVYEEEVPGLR